MILIAIAIVTVIVNSITPQTSQQRYHSAGMFKKVFQEAGDATFDPVKFCAENKARMMEAHNKAKAAYERYVSVCSGLLALNWQLAVRMSIQIA